MPKCVSIGNLAVSYELSKLIVWIVEINEID